MRPIGMRHFPRDRYGLIHRHAAIALGYTDNELSRACARGELVKVIRGVFADRQQRTVREWHRLRAQAVYLTAGDGAVISNETAGELHGLSMLKPAYGRVHLIGGGRANGRRDEHRHVHAGEAAPDELAWVDQIRVTSIERTAVDIACTSAMGFAGALAVFDSALRKGADRSVMQAMLARSRRGVASARRALDYADADSENAGESWGRAQMIEAGLPIPRLQHKFFDQDGRHVARTDYDWQGRLVGEFDGMEKYQKHLREGESPFEAMKREKKREDDLRRMGVMVVRWTWADLEAGRVVGMILEWFGLLGLAAA